MYRDTCPPPSIWPPTTPPKRCSRPAGEEPALLELDADNDTLTLTATGIPRAAGTAVRERLTTRVTALGGTLTTGPPGTVRLRLPLTTARKNEEGQR